MPKNDVNVQKRDEFWIKILEHSTITDSNSRGEIFPGKPRAYEYEPEQNVHINQSAYQKKAE